MWRWCHSAELDVFLPYEIEILELFDTCYEFPLDVKVDIESTGEGSEVAYMGFYTLDRWLMGHEYHEEF